VKVLETERLELRHFTLDDADFVLRLLNEPSFLYFIGDRGVRDLEQAKTYLRDRILHSYDTFGFGIYVVELTGTQEPIGTCGLVKRDGLEDVDIGFAFLPRYWSQGYATESARAVMRYGQEVLGLPRIVAIANADNARSFRVLEKIGLRSDRAIRLSGSEAELRLFVPEPPAG
jgi:RimJ/RimL family protein N-acetyltransferase